MTQHSKDRPPPPTRDEGERISLSDINELDAEEIQAVPSHSSAPPPPPKEALQHVVVPRLAPLKSDSLRPPQVPASVPTTAPEPEADPEMEITETPRRPVRPKRAEDDADDRDVVDIRWVLAAAVLLAVVIGTWTLARRGDPLPTAAATPATNHARVALTLTGLPSGAQVELDGRPVTGSDIMVRSGIRHAVEISADGHETWRQVFITRGELELVVDLEPTRAAATVDPPPAEAPVVEDAPAEAPVAEAPPADEPPAEASRPTAAPSTRPSTRDSTASSMSSSTMSSTSTMTATMRSTHTLVRDPGF